MPAFDRTLLDVPEVACIFGGDRSSDQSEMFKLLGQSRQVHLWSRFTPAQKFSRRYPIRLIRPWLGRFPVGGTFIFVGAYFASDTGTRQRYRRGRS